MKTKILKVRQLENKNQFIMENEKESIFQSYESIIAVYDKDKKILTFGSDWDYSRTTLKHLYIYLYNEIFYSMTADQKNDIRNAMTSNNKRKELQKLIDNKKILLREDL